MVLGTLEYYVFRGAFPNAKKKAMMCCQREKLICRQKESEFIRFQDCYHVFRMGNTIFHCIVVEPSQLR